MSRAGSWFWAREVQLGPLRVHFFRLPRPSDDGFRWAHRLVIQVGRMQTLVTVEPR